ncbi:MAG: hypothetical protein MI864_07715 [Pseudomonadales bacterium]|nr:hypothetical protein [Pseudomonadales bacterium]
MSDLPLVSDLPYTLPQTNASKWNYLANLLNIPPAIEINAGEREIDALAATIMYRHLDRIERIEAMTLINSLPNKRLVNMLVTKAVDTKYLNPQWGMWSMTNEELLADERFHQTISNYSSYMGVSASVLV